MLIDQAVYGYGNGHELLAASALSTAEREQLDRLTDLSGYLPTGFSFISYLSGFPVGQRYALCRTWPDADAPRRGAVLTHVLLLPVEGLAHQRIDVLAGLHRRPSRQERGVALLPVLLPPEAAARVAPELESMPWIGALFGPEPGPVRWEDVPEVDSAVSAAWDLMWPELRRRFRFCTLALSSMRAGDEAFDLLHLPTEARGSFRPADGPWVTPRSPAPAWWPAFARPGALARAVEGARADGTTLPPRHHAWRLVQMNELEGLPGVAAARAYVDLLAAGWPEVGAAQRRWARALGALIDRQHEAGLAPRPLWELTDLLGRPQLRTAWETLSPTLRARLGEVVRDEAGRRAAADGADLGGLWVTVEGQGGPVFEAVRPALWGGALVAAAAASGPLPWLADPRLPEDLRADALGAVLLGRRPSVGALVLAQVWVRELALRLRDHELLRAHLHANGVEDPGAELDLLDPTARRHRLLELPLAEGAAWCLRGGVDEDWRTLGRRPEALSEKLAVLPPSAWAGPGLAALLGAHPASERLRTWRQAPQARQAALQSGLPDVLFGEVVEAATHLELLTASAPDEARPRVLQLLAVRLGVWLTRPDAELEAEGLDLSVLDAWWTAPRVRQALCFVSLDTWRGRITHYDVKDVALPLSLARLGSAASRPDALLAVIAAGASRAALNDARATLLSLPDWSLPLAAEVLGRVRVAVDAADLPLVQRAFRPVYDALLDNHAECRQVSWYAWLDWDRGKAWRLWLPEAWALLGWPAAGLEALVEGDAKLKREVLERYHKKRWPPGS